MIRPKKNSGLRPETKKKLMSVYNDELRAAGLGTFEDVDRLVKGSRNTINIALLASIENILNRMSEPTAQELETIISELRGKLRYEIRPMMDKLAREIKTRLPRRRSGGRGPALTSKQKSEACDAVADLMRKKVPYKTALVRVGVRFVVSARTIQRAWQKRDEHE
jgi:hypothetical protein